ncbi:MAG: sigma-54-dependent transcriptional regulator [Planctomycetota bacterium]
MSTPPPITFLMVDDDPSLQEILKLKFQAKGWKLEGCSSEAEIRPKLASLRPKVLILDIRLQDTDGISLLDALRKEGHDLPALILSAHSSLDNLARARNLDPIEHVEKGADFGEIASALERLLRRSLDHHHARLVSRLPEVRGRFPDFVGKSPALEKLKTEIEKFAPREATVLILGETGTGKELVARHIHTLSTRKGGPFVAVNAAAIQDNLLESELFGHEKGAFTGATTTKPGLFEIAEGGTLFLDEIGDLSPNLQAKLLRVLENREFRRVGGTRTLTTDVRVVAATHRDLAERANSGEFREDLFYRLSTLTLKTPPLRERAEDIPDLLHYFFAQLGAPGRRLAPEALDTLCRHDWPGNVRELRNCVERLVILGADPVKLSDLPLTRGSSRPPSPAGDCSLADLEAQHIRGVLERHSGNKTRAAEILGITKMTLYKKIRDYSLDEFKPREIEPTRNKP